MVGRVEFGVQASRWLRRRHGDEGDDPPFSLDENGFLPSDVEAMQSGFVRPESVAQRGALVLLGEPGSGKTTTFATLTGSSAETAPPPPGQPGTVWVTGSELTDTVSIQELLTDYLAALPEVNSSADFPGELVVVIDQLDESPAIRRLSRRVELALHGKDTSKLRMFVACRTAEYPPQLSVVLEKALAVCTVADLAPLQRQDAAALIASTGVPVEEFLNEVLANKAGFLASVPLTLKMLISAYQEDSAVLGYGPVALFERGVNALLAEPDPARVSSVRTTVEQRQAIASRIAAYLLLCGQRSVWTSSWQGDPTVSLDAVCGGTEVAGAGAFDVTLDSVRETLATALFSRSGPDRVTFAHSSFAAFLAARYLADRLRAGGRAAQRQLTGVFLVSAPDEDSASIPEYLRETAAWLLAHAPSESRWLAEADPEALTAHSVYITSPEIRAALVDGLLNRALTIEFGDRSWQRARWQLTHPEFAEQLDTVLRQAVQNPSTELGDLARARLAVRLAQESGLDMLTSSLVTLAETSGWPVSLRQSAAKAAMEASSEQAVPRLRTLLSSLPSADSALLNDQPHDEHHQEDEDGPGSLRELVGTLLRLLWPGHLTFAEAAPHIQPVRERGFFGMYRWQVGRFPWGVTDSDLADLVAHAEQVLSNFGVNLTATPGTLELDEDDEVTVTQTTHAPQWQIERRTLNDFLGPVVGRILFAANVDQHMLNVARILTWILRSAQSSPMPAAVDLVDQDNQEPSNVTVLRRELAEALVRCFVEQTEQFDSYHAFVITTHWSRAPTSLDDENFHSGLHRADRRRLLDDADFSWAIQRVDDYRSKGNDSFAAAMGHVAASITDLNNRATFDLAYTLEGTPEWEHFRSTFEGIPLDSPLAKAMKANQSQPWSERDAFTLLQNERLQAAVDGNAQAFWQLVKDLWVDPQLGQYQPVSTWDLSSFPGAALWQEDYLRSRLQKASDHFLRAEHDHRADWLGTRVLDYRAHAGFVALTILHDAGTLDSLPEDRWASWVGAIVENVHRHSETANSMHRTLLDYAARLALEPLLNAVSQLIRTHLAHAETSWRLANLPSTVLPTLAALAAETHAAIVGQATDDTTTPPDAQEPVTERPIVLPPTTAARDAAITTWASLLHQPLLAADSIAVADAQRALSTQDDSTTETLLRLAVAAGAALLAVDPETHWPAVYAKITRSSEFAKLLAQTIGRRDSKATIAESLPDDALFDAFQWLAAIHPPGTEVYKSGFRRVTAEDEIHEWRDKILSTLAERGTAEVVRYIRALSDQYPDVITIKAALVIARRAQANSTSPLSPRDVNTLLTDITRRVVHTAVQLAQLITDTLDEISADLHTHPNLLWDCERPPRASKNKPRKTKNLTWRPKPEGTFASYIAHELALRLQGRQIVINREVVIKPTDAGDSGERPDIMVDATPLTSPHTTEPQQVRVPIEIKGPWHDEVLNAQRSQLAERYLPSSKTDAGVYLVTWYPIEHWDALYDRRKTEAKKHGPWDTLRIALTDQAHTIHRETSNRTFPYVLTVPRAQPATDSPP